MLDMFSGLALTENIQLITYIAVAVLAIFTVSFVVKKIFKLAFFFALITVLAYFLMPDLVSSLLLP